MKAFLTFLLLASVSVASGGGTDGFVTVPVEKTVGDFELRIDRSSPLGLYLSTEYIAATGKQSLWLQLHSYQFRHNAAGEDRTVSEENRRRVLATKIHEVVTYKDAAAVVIVEPAEEVMPGYPIVVQLCRLEDGRWTNAGQDIATSVEAAREKFVGGQARQMFDRVAVIERLRQVPTDTAPFVEYLKQHGRAPVDFLLDALADNKIVVWGEKHRRRASWEVMKSAVRDPRFAEVTGTVFMELPSHKQARMDAFFAAETMNPKTVFGIFADEQLDGWFDRGEFEFIVCLWELNRSLPAEKRVKVVLVDFQRPFSEIETKEELYGMEGEDRNTHMADVVERSVRGSTDPRGNLFIVGLLHAYKSAVPGTYSTSRGMTPAPTAGAQLAERFGRENVFAIFQHIGRGDNNGASGGLIRDGVFDSAFAATGNGAIAFPLVDSPFGVEPFDVFAETTLDPRAGTFADNYDGYVFFGPLADEEGDYYLTEIVDEDFVREIRRRMEFMEMEWYDGLRADQLTVESMKNVLTK